MRKVTIQDMWDLGYCSASIRIWFKERDLDYMKFIKNGISFKELEKYRSDGRCDKVLTKVENDG